MHHVGSINRANFIKILPARLYREIRVAGRVGRQGGDGDKRASGLLRAKHAEAFGRIRSIATPKKRGAAEPGGLLQNERRSSRIKRTVIVSVALLVPAMRCP